MVAKILMTLFMFPSLFSYNIYNDNQKETYFRFEQKIINIVYCKINKEMKIFILTKEKFKSVENIGIYHSVSEFFIIRKFNLKGGFPSGKGEVVWQYYAGSFSTSEAQHSNLTGNFQLNQDEDKIFIVVGDSFQNRFKLSVFQINPRTSQTFTDTTQTIVKSEFINFWNKSQPKPISKIEKVFDLDECICGVEKMTMFIGNRFLLVNAEVTGAGEKYQPTFFKLLFEEMKWTELSFRAIRPDDK